VLARAKQREIEREMAFLNMEQQTWAFTFGILGTVLQIDINTLWI
jgi:hypothetical protein